MSAAALIGGGALLWSEAQRAEPEPSVTPAPEPAASPTGTPPP
ncbi:hypothetical protein [Agromyces bauzanensis]|nr:hypothetical protein [Agromyces bauzanensis]